MQDWPDEQLLAATPATPAAFAIFWVSEAVVRKRVSRGLLNLRGVAKGRS